MAKIIDPSDISYVVDTTAGGADEMEIQTGAKTIKLLAQGVLSDASPGATSGITGKCLYSKLKEIWQSDDALNKHRFPIQMIYEASFVWINGWGPQGQQTRDLIRDAGFKEVDGRENACIISLGAFAAGADQAYYAQVIGFNETVANFDKTGELNENIQSKGTGGSPDYSGYMKAFLREMQKTYASYNLLTEQGLAALTYQAYRMPLSNAADINVVDNDTVIGVDAGSISGVVYSELTIDYISGTLFAQAAVQSYVAGNVVRDGDTPPRWARCTAPGTVTGAETGPYGSFTGTAAWEAYPGERLIGGVYYAFNRILDVEDVGNTAARLQEIHSWAQYKCRQAADLNDDINGDAFGIVKGVLALPFTAFVGSTLHTRPGVFIDNYNGNDVNDITFWHIPVGGGGVDAEFAPVTSAGVTFPFMSAGNLLFSQNLVDEPNDETRYTMYFQYITSTLMTALKVTGASGASATLDWSGADVGLLDHLVNLDYVRISGFITEPENNGLWQITDTPAANVVTATKVDGINPSTQAGGEAATVLQNPFESPGAVIVLRNDGSTPIDAQVTAASVAWDFDYTNNDQGGRDNDTQAPVFVVAMANDGAQYILVATTITKTTGQNISVNASDELNYENPA